jgi:hypothetical protein
MTVSNLIIGAPSADQNGRINAGETYVVFGSIRGFEVKFDLFSLDGGPKFRQRRG